MLLALVTATRRQAHEMITNPPEERAALAASPADYDLEYETITLTTADGLDLAAWYIPSTNSAAVIVIHGYKGDRGTMLPQADILARHGFGVLVLDLRAHGESEGEIITFGKDEVQDAEAAYQYLLTRPDVDPERIGILGNSMGGAVAIMAAAQNEGLRAVVADGAFSSLQDTIAIGVQEFSGLPPFPFAPMIQFFAEQETGSRAEEVSPVAVIGQISPRAVFILHGYADTEIPPNSGDLLFAAAGDPRDYWFDYELGHTEFVTRRTDLYEERVVGFFDAYLLGNVVVP